MLTYVDGNLFESPARVLVNTVNVVGVMGKGIAKEFKYFFPEMFQEYQRRCENKTLDIGRLYLYRGPNKWVLNFPTKKHWRQPSKPEYLEAGLKAFVAGYSRAQISSIAFPQLGCGNGELDWENQVRPLMEQYLACLPIDVFVHLYRKSEKLAEHRTPKEMKVWLRSEPENLGFNEVWDDLVALIQDGRQFKAIETDASFSVQLVNDPEAGVLLDAGEPVFVPRESLCETWQCLRSAGFLWAENFVDGLDVYAPQVMALFTALPYVQSTHVLSTHSGREEKYQAALQLLPRSAPELGDSYELSQTAPL